MALSKVLRDLSRKNVRGIHFIQSPDKAML